MLIVSAILLEAKAVKVGVRFEFLINFFNLRYCAVLIVSAILLEASAVEVGVYFLAEWSGMGLEDPVAANGLKTPFL